MPYPFDQIFAADPDNTEMVASNVGVLIFAPGDETKTPLQLTTLTGIPLANPVPVNDKGFGSAFMCDLDQVAWEGGGYTGLFASYRGMKDEAVAARHAAEAALTEVQGPTDEAVDRGIQRANIPNIVSSGVRAEISPLLEPTVKQITASYVASNPAVVDAAAAAVNANPKIAQIEARELPNRGRAYPSASAPAGTIGFGSADDITTNGKYAIWTGADAAALNLPSAASGTLAVYTFGSVVEQIFISHGSARLVTMARRRSGATWNPWTNPGVDDESVTSLLKPGTSLYRAVSEAATAAAPTRTAALALTTGDGGGTEAVPDRSFRIPFKVAANVKRWRVHIQNLNPRYGNRVAGSLEFKGLGFARNAGETDGAAQEGKFSTAVTQISGPFTTNAFGHEYVSPWVTGGIEANKGYLLTGGYTTAVDQQVVAMVGGGWVTASSNDWTQNAPSGLAITRNAPLFIWLELVVDAAVPVVMYFGDSLSSGVSARLPVYDSYPNKNALAHGHIPTLYANSGTTMADHLERTHARWTRYDTAEALTKPDGCWFAMGSNDLATNPTQEVMQSRFNTCWDIISSGFTSKIGVATILPRHDGAATFEGARKRWNEYLVTEAAGRAAAIADTAGTVTSADGSTLDKRFSASPTDIHLTSAGYTNVARVLPPLHR